MVPEIKDLTYEEQLKEMGLPTLHDRRELGDLITMYKIDNGIERIDKEDLMLLIEEDGKTRRHEKIRKFQIVIELFCDYYSSQSSVGGYICTLQLIDSPK
ncbi:hypothetical protein E2C01_014278 [Portunus trituberculatus]|uniref:Uncharacterized protein n=1 Tax=Portunus trituberculatus TaxID=210409 RepID=A0A5B7DK04_PORTR|nr:hypothetical protein [Portunus trituberculatus]